MPKPLESKEQSLAYCYALVNVYRGVLIDHTQKLSEGKSTVNQWLGNMQDSVRTLIALQAITGKSNDPDSIDWKQVEDRVQVQFSYLDSFADDLSSAVEDEQDLTSFLYRSGLYADASKAAFWESYSPVELPNYPGDGESECMGNCLCEWQFEFNADGELEATWIVNDDHPCPTCDQHGEDYNPLVIKLTSQQIEVQDNSGIKYD